MAAPVPSGAEPAFWLLVFGAVYLDPKEKLDAVLLLGSGGWETSHFLSVPMWGTSSLVMVSLAP